MADLKTTAEERARLAEFFDGAGVMHGLASSDTVRILDDVGTLLAENARLLAVAEAAREYHEMSNPGVDPVASRARAKLGDALEALEAP